MPKRTRPVFIADTCVCGLSVLKSLWRSGCAADAVFMADYEVNPLGVKSDGEIAAVAERWIRMAGQHSDTLVMACNTLSVRYHQLVRLGHASQDLKQVVTMADCMQALVQDESSRLAGRNILIIGTAYTASQPLYPEIFAAALPGARVRCIGATELERKIARFQVKDDDVDTLIDAALDQAIREADVAVLACTCFPLVKTRLESLFPGVLFFDPGEYCSDLLEADTPGPAPTLSIKVTGDAVAKESVAEFARSYLGSDSIVTL